MFLCRRGVYNIKLYTGDSIVQISYKFFFGSKRVVFKMILRLYVTFNKRFKQTYISFWNHHFFMNILTLSLAQSIIMLCGFLYVFILGDKISRFKVSNKSGMSRTKFFIDESQLVHNRRFINSGRWVANSNILSTYWL